MGYFYTKAYSEYTRCMGRMNIIDDAGSVKKLHLERVRLDKGGCDPGGAYWGIDIPLYVTWGDGSEEMQEYFVRAWSRCEAKEELRKIFTNATFYR